ncbi:hypothetical protein [Nostoc sp. JL33]|uniref:hypothetical protein n=1 Tax=Nostoc sp. JL33 TaxID=2815396 RepID=UPI0025EE1E19|nr:hypothetical protein [Nostoc sp. JL33]MBN3871517.1 hypothetical protein [Nostoc sp. JL33]
MHFKQNQTSTKTCILEQQQANLNRTQKEQLSTNSSVSVALKEKVVTGATTQIPSPKSFRDFQLDIRAEMRRKIKGIFGNNSDAAGLETDYQQYNIVHNLFWRE